MLGPLNIPLEEFGVSSSTGFLPDQLPLWRLTNAYYDSWETILHRLPSLLRQHRLRCEVDALPTLSTSRLVAENEWQRAYLVLSFLTHAYIWGGESPSERLPAAISIPFLEVSSHLGLPATATYSALNLWNFTAPPNSDLSQVDNLSVLHTFTGSEDEAWFYLISVAIEARGAEIIRTMLKAMDAVRADDAYTVGKCLLKFADTLPEIAAILDRMYEKCDPEVFYHKIRPFLAGSKNMGSAGLPSGVFYEEGDREGQWRQYSGGSNAQSSLIQFFDIVLGVEHSPTKNSKVVEVDLKAKHGFLLEMRKYMPGNHRSFLQRIESAANIRDYVKTSACTEDVTAAYNLAVARFTAFRDVHIQIVTRYIILPSRKMPPTQSSGLNLAVASTMKKSSDGLSGTGGTELLPFLKQGRDETIQTVLP
ncbi:Indoleamine 2 [Hyphodiscus hymeniophilus]|uniref:Indoleamine 2,3-dioxygenase n=1 Tax=Hyphodiscus hymeniophilus TaxID=353542 RepID=A0A9P6VLR6_9HELO|nr:Indoleamine 2 [Hyphodiscus hymeniophilus]